MKNVKAATILMLMVSSLMPMQALASGVLFAIVHRELSLEKDDGWIEEAYILADEDNYLVESENVDEAISVLNESDDSAVEQVEEKGEADSVDEREESEENAENIDILNESADSVAIEEIELTDLLDKFDELDEADEVEDVEGLIVTTQGEL